MAEKILEARDITFASAAGGAERAFFSVDPGGSFPSSGPTGGKTTLLNTITGVYSLDSGKPLPGRPISRLKTHQIAALGIHRTFQQSQLFHD
jgi:branched-chain amino acid transport system ATP-binding protein